VGARPLGSLFQPVIGTDFAVLTPSHAIGGYYSALRQDGDIEVFGELDIADTAIPTTITPISSSCELSQVSV
jgi:hypothetical protein